MNFFKSLKLIYVLFVFSTFLNPLLGMHQDVIEKLVKLFSHVETSAVIHEGTLTELGGMALKDFFSKPERDLQSLKLRQEVLKQLVAISDSEFTEIRSSVSMMLMQTIKLVNFNLQIKNGMEALAKAKASILDFRPEIQNPIMPLISLMFIWVGLTSMYTTSANGVDFSMAMVTSLFLGALWEVVLGYSSSIAMPINYGVSAGLGFFMPDKSGILGCSGNTLSQIELNGTVARLQENVCKSGEQLLCSGKNAYCIASGASPKLVHQVVANQGGVIPWLAGGLSWFANRLSVGGGVLSVTHLNRYLHSINFKRVLDKKSREFREGNELFKMGIDAFEDEMRVKEIKLTRADLSEMGIDELDSIIKYMGTLDAFLGIAALIRESKKECSLSYVRYPVAFIEFIELPEFHFHAHDFCDLSKIDPKYEYKIGSENKSKYICPDIKLSRTEFNEGLLTNSDWQQIILAKSFGIVFGSDAKMSLDKIQLKWLNRILFGDQQ